MKNFDSKFQINITFPNIKNILFFWIYSKVECNRSYGIEVIGGTRIDITSLEVAARNTSEPNFPRDVSLSIGTIGTKVDCKLLLALP